MRKQQWFYAEIKNWSVYKKKLNIWDTKGWISFEMFSSTHDFLPNNDVKSDVIKPFVIDHLSNLLKVSEVFFPDLTILN